MNPAHHPDAIAPTVPAQPQAVVGFPAPLPRSRSPWPLAGAALLAGLGLGLAIGLAVAGSEEVAIENETAAGELAVASEPPGGVVVVDGRVVGLTPVSRIELAPGEHSIVIDLYGYHPYLGTLTIEEGAKAGLDAYLAALGDETAGPTRGALSGGGRIVTRALPRSALAAPLATPDAGVGPKQKKRKKTRKRRAPSPPARDCYGEERQCKRGCDRARTDCDFSCPTCSSCLTTMGWPECRRRCEACRQGCKSNRTFCQSQCESARDRCRG